MSVLPPVINFAVKQAHTYKKKNKKLWNLKGLRNIKVYIELSYSLGGRAPEMETRSKIMYTTGQTTDL